MMTRTLDRSSSLIVCAMLAFGTATPCAVFGAAVDVTAPGLIVPVKQPKTMDCWAATATMMKSWKDSSSYTIDAVVDGLGSDYRGFFDQNAGVPAAKFQDYVNKLKAKNEPLACYTVQAIADMLKQSGPLLVIHNPTGDPTTFMLHAMIVTKMLGDGSLYQTQVTYIDPADGKEHQDSFRTFITKYESAAADVVSVQIIHY